MNFHNLPSTSLVEPLPPAPRTLMGPPSVQGWTETGSMISGTNYGARIVKRPREVSAQHAVIVWTDAAAWIIGTDSGWTYDNASVYMDAACTQIRRDIARKEADEINAERIRLGVCYRDGWRIGR